MRKVNINDADTLFKWRDDPFVRRMSFNSDELNYKNHLEWLNAKLNDPDCFMYINTTGQVRFDIKDGTAFVDMSVSKEYRGLGLAIVNLLIAINILILDCTSCGKKIHTIHGIIFHENIRSIKVFHSLGMRINPIKHGISIKYTVTNEYKN